MGEDIYAAKGNSAEAVTTYQNEPTSPRPSPILEVSPERGTFLRFLNAVIKGTVQGIPLYLKLRDSNGDPLPVNTEIKLELQVAGMDKEMVVSETMKSIDQYQTLSLSEQRNTDNIDSTKFTLQYPDAAPESGPAPKVDVRDIDAFYVTIESAVQVDWSQSEAYFDSDYVQKLGR
ncbi:hypothetical protein [Haloarcula onubensis]|uniref:Uncharacterized protein n=1 Tax=Haloarcula onubensis TaxID=2950539 RepID=A0ABU2FK58_9EURY|nr:hypothetical protein [Halomicroarcula sp. S3CR25-11]MDS0280627.1 hypothetical protein [Halomicroarcula sp. S3CR25-11]